MSFGSSSDARLAQLLDEAKLAPLSPDALQRFKQYLDLLIRWNSRLNLTAIRTPEGILRRHFAECIQCAQALPVLETPTLLDFGSGAGLPGIPIAICRPEIHVTLAESQGKKAAFLREAVRTLQISAEVFHGRVENMADQRQFGAVTLRAVDRMQEACGAAFPRITKNGWIVLLSSIEAKPEIEWVLPFIHWQKEIQSVGLSQGLLLMGQCREQPI